MKTKKIFALLFLSLCFFINSSFACTNFIVTKGASVKGSVMITYTADSYNMYGELYHSPARVYPNGTMLEIYNWDTGKYLGQINQVPFTYNVIGNMNEHQVVIGETTFGGRRGLSDPKGIMDYGSLIHVTLQRAKTAREAIEIMTNLVEEYGYCSSGESFSIGDKNEAWILEMIGKGEGNKGAVWVAIRIPDGYVSGHANQSRITTFPLNEPDNCIYSKDVITFARERKFFEGRDSEFSFADAYDPLTFGNVRACDARVWSMFRRVNNDMEKYISYIMGESTERIPLYIKPDKKLSLHDVMDIMRDHYQGTELDMTKGIAAGPYGMPYRWRPLRFTYEGSDYFNERPISTPQTGWSFISQSRSHLPDEIGGVFWFGFDDTYMTVYTPLYSSMTRIPHNFAPENSSLSRFNWESTFWIFNLVSNYAYPKFSIIIDDIQIEQNKLEGNYIYKQETIENQALALLKNSRNETTEFLTNYSISAAENTHNAWKKLYEKLVVKYLDGIKKDEYFRPVNIGYPEEFKKLIVKTEGDNKIVKRFPIEIENSFRDLVRAGDEYLENKNYIEATKSYQRALELRPNEVEIQSKVDKIKSFLDSIDEIHKENFL